MDLAAIAELDNILVDGAKDFKEVLKEDLKDSICVMLDWMNEFRREYRISNTNGKLKNKPNQGSLNKEGRKKRFLSK